MQANKPNFVKPGIIAEADIVVKKIVAIVLLIICSLGTGCAVNPVTGQKQLMLVSRTQLKEIGKKYAPEVEKQMGGRIENVDLQNYISKVGHSISSVSHTPSERFKFVAVNDESINAVALPGGHIFITRGMLEKMKNEAQLASVLAHETAHVTSRHVGSAMSNQIGVDILMSLVTSEKTGRVVMTAANMGIQLIGLKFSRDHETQADGIGMDYMVKAGYEPVAMVEVMKMLDAEGKTKRIVFLSTHPDPGGRAYELQQRIRWRRYGKGLKVGFDEYGENVTENLKKVEAKEEEKEDPESKKEPNPQA